MKATGGRDVCRFPRGSFVVKSAGTPTQRRRCIRAGIATHGTWLIGGSVSQMWLSERINSVASRSVIAGCAACSVLRQRRRR